ncbi:hypothetical protein APED_28360 [Acanthopleuribacter pedis]
MAECDFFIEEEDFRGIVEFFLKKSCFFVPDLNYFEPKVESINNLEEVISIRKKKACSLFLL